MKKKGRGIETIKKRYGIAFISPWLFGLAVFFFIPLLTSIIYSLSTVTIGSDGLKADFIGLTHYKNLIFSEAWYLDRLIGSVGNIFKSLPIILALSLIFAIILNQEFKGRMIMRAIFFLPVIFASDVVMGVMAGDTTSQNLTATLTEMGGNTSAYMDAVDFSVILERLNLPTELNKLMEEYLGDTFNLIWSCGVQTLLFISGLQTIPKQLYEVGKVEGATAWESFWYITIPMLSRIIMLVLFYTMIELFVIQSDLVSISLHSMRNDAVYDRTSAQLLLYFLVIGLIMGLIFLIFKKIVQKKID